MDSPMRTVRPIPLLILALFLCCHGITAATFGTVTAPTGGASYSDIVLDEPRSLVYLVNSGLARIEVFNIKTRAFATPIATDAQPVSAAISKDRSSLYVTSYSTSTLDIIDLTRNQLLNRIGLPTSPEGVAVGADGKVLITAVSATGGTANTLLIYDPAKSAALAPIQAVSVVPPAATPPILPPPSNRAYNSFRSRLAVSADGKFIIGVNGPNANTRVVFVYETASGTVLRSRTVANLSTVIAISPDASKFMAGPVLFDLLTLQVLAQENTANAPFVFPNGNASNFNLQANQGGSVFSPDGSVLYAAFNIAPVGSTRANTTELLLNDPDNLLISMGIQMPENLAGKMVIDAAGANIYAISDSGFITLPVGTINQQPLAIPQSRSVLLTKDTCNIFTGTTAVDVVANTGRGRITATVAPYVIPQQGGQTQIPGFPFPIPTQPTPQTSITTPNPVAQAVNTGSSPQINFTYSPTAGTNPGTIGPTDFLVSSPEAINIPGNIHVYQNYRDSVSTGTVMPIAINAQSTYGVSDILLDSARRRIYLTNSGLNRVEVFDTQKKTFLTPIKVGQLPVGMAMGLDGVTLYVANSGGESISIVDLNKGVQTGRVVFPAFPLNAAVAVAAPVAIAATSRGPQFVLSTGGTQGTLWKVIGNQAIPRPLNPVVFGTTATTVSGGGNTATGFWSLAATPGGENMILMTGTGNAYLYDYTVDDFTIAKQVLAAPLTGFRGPVTAGPQGRYYAVGGTILNASLTPVVGSLNGSAPNGRPVAAVASVSANQVALFTTPLRPNAAAPVQDAGTVELYDPVIGAPAGSATALEGPASVIIGNNGAVTQFAHLMVVDPSGPTAYAVTAQGLSIINLANAAAPPTLRPSVNTGGIVNLGDYTAPLAPGGMMAIFGKNLGSTQSATSPLKTLLGGVCVTLNGTPIPLAMTSTGQINAQVPLELAAGRYPLVIRSIDNQAASAPSTITLTKYAPAVMIAAKSQPTVFHSNGGYVTAEAPAKRDETLTIYATGMGPTHGGIVKTGQVSPSTPVADTDPVQVFFGNPLLKQSKMIVKSSHMVPGLVGVDEIQVTVPGFHTKGAAVPILIKVGSASSLTTGPNVPVIAIE